MLATASNGDGLCDINLSRKSLLVLLYSSIVSAISNVVDFMVSTSKLVGIALGFAALLSKELQALVNAVDIGRHGKAPSLLV